MGREARIVGLLRGLPQRLLDEFLGRHPAQALIQGGERHGILRHRPFLSLEDGKERSAARVSLP